MCNGLFPFLCMQAVNAEGESLADLLDTYMKNCSKDKNIKPFGGGLFQNYTYAWNPQGNLLCYGIM